MPFRLYSNKVIIIHTTISPFLYTSNTIQYYINCSRISIHSFSLAVYDRHKGIQKKKRLYLFPQKLFSAPWWKIIFFWVKKWIVFFLTPLYSSWIPHSWEHTECAKKSICFLIIHIIESVDVSNLWNKVMKGYIIQYSVTMLITTNVCGFIFN